jgi:hypothetical protein
MLHATQVDMEGWRLIATGDVLNLGKPAPGVKRCLHRISRSWAGRTRALRQLPYVRPRGRRVNVGRVRSSESTS